MKAMKLQIGDYEIEIKATNTMFLKDNPMNEHDTLRFLNTLAIAFRHYGMGSKEKGYDASAEYLIGCANQCHDFCEEHNYYN